MKRVLMVLGLACCVGSGVSLASEDHEQAKRLRESGAIVPLEQILEDARLPQGGRIIAVELEQKRDRFVYEVEFVDAQGAVHEYYYDAGDGRFLWEKPGEDED